MSLKDDETQSEKHLAGIYKLPCKEKGSRLLFFLTVAILEATRRTEETERGNSQKEEDCLFDVLMALTLHSPCRNR